MLQKIVFIMVAIVLLAACTTNTTPQPQPQASPTPQPVTTESYPVPGTDPNNPVNSSTPQVYNPYPFAPAASDNILSRGNVYLDSAEVLILESFPPQYVISLSGNLPTPCNELRVNVPEPDEQNVLNIEVYSVIDANAVCTQALEPFSEQIGLPKVPAGDYTVNVNGELVGELTVQQ